MKTVNLSWDMPTTRESGLPLALPDILHTEISMSADLGANFTLIGTVLSSDASVFVQPDLVVGDYIFRLIVADVDNRLSIPVDVPVNVADETPPGAVSNILVTFS